MTRAVDGQEGADLSGLIDRAIDARIDARLDAVAARLASEVARHVVELLSSADRVDAVHVGPLLTVAGAAKLLSLSRSTIYELIRRGELTALKVGGARRISAEALEAYRRSLSDHSQRSAARVRVRRAPAA